MLAAWGITADGKPAFIGLAPGTGESFDAWKDFRADLRDRGLASAAAHRQRRRGRVIGAIEQVYPKALRQRCVIHRCRNLLAKIPAGMQAEVNDAYWKIFDTEDLKTPPGPKLVEIIDARIGDLAAKYQGIYPAAAKVLLTDRVGLTACLRFPPNTTMHPALRLRRAHLWRDPPTGQGHRQAPRRDLLPHPGLGRARPGLPRLALSDHGRRRPAAAPGPAPFAPQATPPTAATHGHHRRVCRRSQTASTVA